MKSNNRKLVIAFLGVTALTLCSIALAASDIVKIVGEVNDAHQIVTDGEVFEVDDTPEGNDLVTNYISQRVEVTGKLRIEGDMRVITVKEFRTMEE
jgi:hypothetical protein